MNAAGPVGSGAGTAGVLQMRLVVEADDLDAAERFYRDALGLSELASYEADGGARVVILDAGRATLELMNPAQKAYVDRVEKTRLPAPKLRVAFQVKDSAGTAAMLADVGAEILAPATETPWRSLNARLEAPAGLQVTLFQELEPEFD